MGTGILTKHHWKNSMKKQSTAYFVSGERECANDLTKWNNNVAPMDTAASLGQLIQCDSAFEP